MDARGKDGSAVPHRPPWIGGPACQAYALAHLGKSLLWTAGDAVTIFMLIRHGGFAPAVAGGIFLAALAWNALCDLLAGLWLDRRARAGRSSVPVIALAAPVGGLAFAAGLLMPPGQPVAWTLLFCLLFRTAFALYDVPHNAMMARLARTVAERANLAKLRTIAAGIASILVGLVAIPLTHGQTEADPWRVAAPVILLALAAILMLVPHIRMVSRLERMPPAGDGQEDGFPPGGSVPGTSLWALCISTIIGTAGLGVIGKVIPHLDLSGNDLAATALLLLMLGRFAAAWCTGPMTARLGAPRALALSYPLAAAACLGLPLAVLLPGVAPLVWIAVLGACLALPVILSWVELASFVRFVPAGGDRANAMVGLFTMVTKLATGVGGVLLGLALGAPVPGSAPGATMAPAMLWVLCILVAAGALAAGLLLHRQQGSSVSPVP